MYVPISVQYDTAQMLHEHVYRAEINLQTSLQGWVTL